MLLQREGSETVYIRSNRLSTGGDLPENAPSDKVIEKKQIGSYFRIAKDAVSTYQAIMLMLTFGMLVILLMQH